MFIPTTRDEMARRRWDALDIVLVTGDAYIDSPYNGAAIIGHHLIAHGFRVGIIAQPATDGPPDITRLGEPLLFWGVTAGSVDSMVSNHTALGKRRREDDLTAGGVNDRRPDRASIVYAGLIRRYFKHTVPIVLGGIEASLRRVAHYDLWSDTIRRGLLFDAKADILVYGMAERAVVELATALRDGWEWRDIRGLCYIADAPVEQFLGLPPYEKAAENDKTFTDMFLAFYRNSDPLTARGMHQRHGDKWLIHNPPQPALTPEELDAVYELPYEYDAHPSEKERGEVRALETIKFSVTTHRGCYGECSFCAIHLHQGRRVVSRSEDSIVREITRFLKMKRFTGVIYDLGGPTANMYGIDCARKSKSGACREKRCLHPSVCRELAPDHRRQLALLKRVAALPGVKRVFVASGVRHDLVLADKEHGEPYLAALVSAHISGQMKIAPEHTEDPVLARMGKPSKKVLRRFRELFDTLNRKAGKRQFLTYYFIAAHPGCTEADMRALARFCREELHLTPEQIQVFTPTPSTMAALMYRTGRDPLSGEALAVERSVEGKKRQREAVKGSATLRGAPRSGRGRAT